MCLPRRPASSIPSSASGETPSGSRSATSPLRHGGRARRSDAARRLADAILAVLLAPACAACGHPHDTPTRTAVCDRCWAGVIPFSPPLCDGCGDPLPTWRAGVHERCPACRDAPRAFASARAIGPYEGALRSIVHALKYGGRRSAARPLGNLMQVYGREVLEGADFAVPVPLHYGRRWRRGFNQAAELARRVGLPVRHALRRTRHTVPQTDLSAAERLANVRAAFALRRGAHVRDRCIVLIDDVSTTGATLDACARVLLDAGAREVRALTAARAVSRPR